LSAGTINAARREHLFLPHRLNEMIGAPVVGDVQADDGGA
jgi:hypothetical protein